MDPTDSSSEGTRREAIDEAVDVGALDRSLAVVAGVTSALPGVGGPLAAAVGEWRAAAARRRLTAILDAFHEDLKHIENAIDEEHVRTETFERSFETLLESAIAARHAAKRDYYAAALARTATRDRPSEAEHGLMVDTLDALQPLHLAILAAVATDTSPPREAQAYLDQMHMANRRLRNALPKVSRETLNRCWEDLARLGLVASVSTLTVEYGLARPAGQPDPPIVTDFGRRFLAFINPTP